MFGTVAERNPKDLEMSQVVVELCDRAQIKDDLFKAQYTMAESEVYFEPYYQVCFIAQFINLVFRNLNLQLPKC